jgi:ligand-binding sensor domain-containing protein
VVRRGRSRAVCHRLLDHREWSAAKLGPLHPANSDGYLWLTTFDGLVRFDGVRFTVFNKADSPGLTSNRFVHLLAEKDGTLWASTESDGFVRYRA